jgi:alpha-1,3-rhamnosyltransferase
MSSRPKVTISIPSYNHARFLPEAVESALGQTYPHIEILIVDDGSTDDSLAIAQSYQLKYPEKIRAHTHPGRRNLGISATVNEAVKLSTGVYFSGLPSDDRLLPEKVEKQVAFLESHPQIGWVYGPARYIDARGDKLHGQLGEDISHDARPLEKLIIANRVPGMTVLARREYFEAVGAHDEDLIYSDWHFWIRMAARYRVGFMRKALVEYRLHGNNTSVGGQEEENLRRGLAVMNSLRNPPALVGEIAKPETQALIELRRCRHLFYLGQSEEAAKSCQWVFETCSALPSGPKDLSRWLLLSSEHSTLFDWMIEQLAPAGEGQFKQKMTSLLRGLSLARAAVESRAAGDFQRARRCALQAQIRHPRWLFDRVLLSVVAETLVGSPLMNRARNLKQQL